MRRNSFCVRTWAAAFLACASIGAAAQEPPPEPPSPPPEAAVEAPQPAEPESPAVPTKMFRLYAENWKWTPAMIRVAQGTRVRLQFVSRDASHSFVLKDYDIKVPLPEGIKTAEVEFVADRVGEFRWTCGRPCGDGCGKMVGQLIVE